MAFAFSRTLYDAKCGLRRERASGLLGVGPGACGLVQRVVHDLASLDLGANLHGLSFRPKTFGLRLTLSDELDCRYDISQ
jgi:hypothetical protein